MTLNRAPGHLTQPERALDAQLAEMAVSRHAVFSLEELLPLGLSGAAIRRRAASGRLHRLHHSVYALVPPELLSLRGRYRAAVLACTGSRHPAALSHRSAADLHGLRDSQRRTVEVIVPGRSTHRHPGIQVHRSVNLAPVDRIELDGITVTNVSRTLLDLAAVIPRRGLERALDQAENRRVFDLTALLGQLERNPRHPGAGRVRATLDRYRIGSAPTASRLEETFFAFCHAHEFPLPEVNRHVDPGDGEHPLRPDFVWRDLRIAVEVDGAETHLTHHAFQEDRRRDQRLVAAGWRVIRTTWQQLTERPHELAAILRQLLHADRAALLGI